MHRKYTKTALKSFRRSRLYVPHRITTVVFAVSIALTGVYALLPGADGRAPRPIALWVAPFTGDASALHYFAARSACAHGSIPILPTFNRTTGKGVATMKSWVNTTGCPYPGPRYTIPQVDWYYNSTNFSARGSHRIAAVWNLNWIANLSASDPMRGPSCPRCYATATYVIGVWIGVFDVSTGVGSCPFPCPLYNWSVSHTYYPHPGFYEKIGHQHVDAVTPGVLFSGSQVYQLWSGVEVWVEASAHGPGSAASASLALGSGTAPYGVELVRLKVV
jgi:hypothetical protein